MDAVDIERGDPKDKNDNQDAVSTQLRFDNVVIVLLLVRRWLSRKREIDEEAAAKDELVRSVFDSTTSLPRTDVAEDRSPRAFIQHCFDVIVNWSFSPHGHFFHVWSSIVFIGCFYNLFSIVVMVFEDLQRTYYSEWVFLNIFFDAIFTVDMFILTRKQCIEDGVVTTGFIHLLLARVNTREFIYDVISILPLNFIMLIDRRLFLSRIIRLLKCYRISDFMALTESRSSMPNLLRVLQLFFVCFVLFHWNACLYFFVSVIYDYPSAELEDWIFSYSKIPNPIFVTCDDLNVTDGVCTPVVLRDHVLEFAGDFEEPLMSLEPDNRTYEWKFSSFAKQYSLSLYWSALTLTTLGEQPSPTTSFQCCFEICDTLLGLIVFATIIGLVGNMVTTMNEKKTNFEDILDGCKRFMNYRKVTKMLQRKAVGYFTYMWKHGGIQVDEQEVADFLPPRLYGQMAIQIHMDTLRKVKLFEECEANLLYELILQLEPRVYSPHDYICKKGEIGTEMYIVKKGAVEVVSEDGTKVFVRLGSGTVFGELSILNIAGNKNGDRRTASVRSVGYSDLYVLSKESLWEALREYPHGKEALIRRGKEILAKDNLLDEDCVDSLRDDNAPIEEQLEWAVQDLKQIELELDQAEKDFRDYSRKMKRRLFRMERDMMEIM